MLHHPYNSMEPVLEMLEKAADDVETLSIKITIYRLAKDSRVTAALTYVLLKMENTFRCCLK